MQSSDDKRRILVIDDEEKVRTILRHFLEKAGYEVFTAPDGDSGVKAAVASAPDLIILDVMMPVKDGFSACAELKKLERTRNVPVVFLTAKGGPESRKSAQYRAAAAFVDKPFKNEELLAVVKATLTANEAP